MNIIKKALKKNYLNEIFLLLNSIDALSELTYPYKSSISRYFLIKTLQPGETLLHQGAPMDNIYLVKKGTFSLDLIRNSSFPVLFDIECFLQYQNISKEHFSRERKHEIDGQYNYKEVDRLMVYCQGEIIGDIEWYLERSQSIFQVKAGTQGGEVVYIETEKFMKLISNGMKKFTKLTEQKIEGLNDRMKSVYRNKKEVCEMTKGKAVQNYLLYQYGVTQQYNKSEVNNNTCNSVNAEMKGLRRNKSVPLSIEFELPKVDNANVNTYYDNDNNNKIMKTRSKMVQLRKVVTFKTGREKKKQLQVILDTNKLQGNEKTKTVKELLTKLGKCENNNNNNDTIKKFFFRNELKRKFRMVDTFSTTNGFNTVGGSNYIDDMLEQKAKTGRNLLIRKEGERRSIGLDCKGELMKKFDLGKFTEKREGSSDRDVPLNKGVFLNKNIIGGLLKEKYTLFRSFSQEKLCK